MRLCGQVRARTCVCTCGLGPASGLSECLSLGLRARGGAYVGDKLLKVLTELGETPCAPLALAGVRQGPAEC